MLTSFAPEILLLILDCLPTKALFSVRATCQAFWHIVTPRVFSHVSFARRRPRHVPDRRFRRRLQFLSYPSCTIALYITSLWIGTLCSADRSLLSQDVLLIRATLSHDFIPFISKLRNLETVQ
jgi:F-box-like